MSQDMASAINDGLYDYEDELWDPSDDEAWVSYKFSLSVLFYRQNLSDWHIEWRQTCKRGVERGFWASETPEWTPQEPTLPTRPAQWRGGLSFSGSWDNPRIVETSNYTGSRAWTGNRHNHNPQQTKAWIRVKTRKGSCPVLSRHQGPRKPGGGRTQKEDKT